jgi:hypothetical protein
LLHPATIDLQASLIDSLQAANDLYRAAQYAEHQWIDPGAVEQQFQSRLRTTPRAIPVLQEHAHPDHTRPRLIAATGTQDDGGVTDFS